MAPTTAQCLGSVLQSKYVELSYLAQEQNIYLIKESWVEGNGTRNVHYNAQ